MPFFPVWLRHYCLASCHPLSAHYGVTIISGSVGTPTGHTVGVLEEGLNLHLSSFLCQGTMGVLVSLTLLLGSPSGRQIGSVLFVAVPISVNVV